MPARKIRPPNKPMWMNREISRAMDKKRRLWRRRVPAEDYKAAEKKVRNLVRNTKRNFAKKLARIPEKQDTVQIWHRAHDKRR